jgi:hypothetical protein
MNYAAILAALVTFVQANPHLWESVLAFWDAIHAKQAALGHAAADQTQHDELHAAIAEARAKVEPGA